MSASSARSQGHPSRPHDDSALPFSEWAPADEAFERGRAALEAVPHEAHAEVPRAAARPSVTEFLQTTHRGRRPDLFEMRLDRLTASPFALLRGTAGLMACDLTGSPVTGFTAQLCGDAHAANFGLYTTAHGRVVMDINDFDESVVGPWEWDLKRLATSLVLASQQAGHGRAVGGRAAQHASRSYRKTMRHLAAQPFLESWHALGDEAVIARTKADALLDDFADASVAALRNDNERFAVRWVDREGEPWTFRHRPPRMTPVDDATRTAVVDALRRYPATLHESRRHLVARYRFQDVAFRVVGTGSVGLASYLALLRGNGREPLVLQLKQAAPSSLAPYLPPEDWPHHGERVVHAARVIQVDTDPLLGWTSVGEVPFIVRVYRNRSAALDAATLATGHLDDYGRLAGALLARAHSRTVDPRLLHGYCQGGKELDRAVSAFARGYAAQVEQDHLELVEARASLIAQGPR